MESQPQILNSGIILKAFTHVYITNFVITLYLNEELKAFLELGSELQCLLKVKEDLS